MIDLRSNPIIYITRDIERALGLGLYTPGYYIISNSTSFAKSVAEGYDNILLIESDKQLDTWELLQDTKTKDFIDNNLSPIRKGGSGGLVVFKPTTQIEKICKENNWTLLNPPAELADKIEEKISGLEWLGELQKYLPEHKLDLCKNILWEDKKFIIQFNHAHSGLGTILVESNKQLAEIKQKFPDRPVKITEYISGPIFTSNNVVTKNKTLVGNISYQITGLQPFTDNPFTTIGNDWSFANKYLNEEQKNQYDQIVEDIGNKLRTEGWKGLFGIDVVVDKSDDKIYLIEINARQPASTTYESELQRTTNNEQGTDISTFEAHLLGLLSIDNEKSLIKIKDGAQIVQRVTKDIPSLHEPKYNKRPDFKIIKYNNTKLNSDLLRTQTLYPLIEAHNKLNKNGLKIIDFITVTGKGNGWDLPRGAIIPIKDGKILLIERQKYSQHFFTPPGGTKEEFDNDILATARREGKEETDLNFTIPEQTPLHFNVGGRDEYYFFAENISGEPKLGEEETERSNENNSYKLVWVDLNELKNIKLLPEGITEQILKRYDK